MLYVSWIACLIRLVILCSPRIKQFPRYQGMLDRLCIILEFKEVLQSYKGRYKVINGTVSPEHYLFGLITR